MSLSNLDDSKIVQDHFPSFEFVYDITMRLKNIFLRETFLEILGNGEDKSRLICAANLSLIFLNKQQQEAVAFMERIKKGGVTVGELIEFRKHRINAIYCPLCLEEIIEDNKTIECCSCKNIFHEQCFREEFNSSDKCDECKKDEKII